MFTEKLRYIRNKYLGKLTIKEPYSKTKWLSVRVRGYLDLFRAFTLLAPIVVSIFVMMASIAYNSKNLPSNWLITMMHASGTIALINAASNALNQATDVEADKISKPYRPIPLGIVRPDEAQSFAFILYLFALLRSVTLNVWFGVFAFIIMILTLTYSLPPRIKKYLFINQVWIALGRGFFGVMASWSVFADNPFQLTPIMIGIIATIYLIGGMSTKDIVDSEADRLTGTKTMINTYGRKKTALYCFLFMFFPFVFVPIFINLKLIATYLIPLTILCIPSILVAYLIFRGTESKTLENVHAWSIMYVQYMVYAMMFSLLIIFRDVLPF